jgi:nitrilase
MAPIIRVATCHISPIFLNAKATTEKALVWIREAAQNGAHLVVFPETYISAFPLWSPAVSPGENHEFFRRMAAESVYADGEELTAIRNAAREHGIFVSVGFSEKARYSSATLWNSNLIISSTGEVLVHHRKLMPTFWEKLTWSHGDGHGLKVVDVPITAPDARDSGNVKLGMLICGENTNPLARYSLIAQGEQLHISTWPCKSPMRNILPSEATPAINGNHPAKAAGNKVVSGHYDNLAANRTRASAHCFEAKCFGVICAGFMSPEMMEILIDGAPEYAKETVKATYESAKQAESRFLDPAGAPFVGFTVDAEGSHVPTEALQNEEGILYADLDISRTVEGKQFQDIVGGYQRFDVFDVKVDTTRRFPATFV